MSYYVPGFEMDEDYSIPTSSSALTKPKNSTMIEEDEITELLWQNGQVVVQSQRTSKKPHITTTDDQAVILNTSATVAGREIRSETETTTTLTATPHLFMQEDEMTTWLHYPIDVVDSSFDRDFYPDFLYTAPAPPPPPSTTSVTSEMVAPPLPPSPIPPPPRRDYVEAGPSNKFENFTHFSSRPKARRRVVESGPSSSGKAVRESTVVDSNETPGVGLESTRISNVLDSTAQVNYIRCGGTMTGGSGAAMELETACQLSMASSSNNSGGSVSAELGQKPEDRKRKGRQTEDTQCHSEDVEFEYADAKKQARGSSTKRSRAAEVHNLSERRRRDRINEKMKALQELIPRCNKSDKASMLDEAIEYLKSLQLQVQMMSMGCSMVPMIFPGVQQYMPQMAMGMGIGMGMNRAMAPFSSVLQGSAMPNSAGAADLGTRFPMPPFHMPSVPVTDPSRIQATNKSDPLSIHSQNPNQPRIPNFSDPYQQYLGLQQMQASIHQTRAVMQPGDTKPSSSKEVGNSENHQSG